MSIPQSIQEPCPQGSSLIGPRRFDHKVIHCLGDSITQGVGDGDQGWVSLLKTMLPDTIIRNYGISGTTISSFPEKGQEFVFRYRDMEPGADVVIVFGGINDYNHSLPLGDLHSEGPDTFYGALKILVPGLIEKYPLADLMFITPIKASGFKGYPHWNAGNEDGHTLKDYRDAIVNVCSYYAVPVLDLFHVSGLGPDIPCAKELLLPDGLHPSPLGYQRVVRKIYNFLVWNL